MRSLIFKNTIAVFLLLFSLQTQAQNLDSLVRLPWDIVKLSSCDDNMGEGPKFNGISVFIKLVSDDVEEDEFGNCILRTRTWDIFDWSANEWHTFSQKGIIDLPEPLMCQESVYLTNDQLPITLNKDNLLLNEEANHQYSFKYYDIEDIEREVGLNGTPYFDLYMYDHTANKICKSNVFKTECQEDMVINIPEYAEIVFDEEQYIEVTLDMLGVDVVLPCDTYTTKVKIGNTTNNFLSSQSIGKVLKVEVELDIENVMKIVKYMSVKVSGIGPDPISMYIEDQSFAAGETIELDIWSENIINLGAWSLQLELEGAKILSLENGELFGNIPINLYPDGKTIRALWYSITGLPIDIESDGTWFTLIIETEIDGSTLDIFTSEQHPWNSITIDEDNNLHDIDAEFNFNVAPRDFLSANSNVQKADMKVFPNPASNKITVSGLSDSGLTSIINVYNLEGKLLLTESVQNNRREVTIDISDLPAGLFILKTQNGNVLTSQKIFKI